MGKEEKKVPSGVIGWLVRVLKGVIIALGFILPGVSGGVLAAILGIYERLLSFMAHLTKQFKENFLFFLPVGIGGILGIGLLSAPLEWLLAHHQLIVLWGFAGAIVGTLPALAKESTNGGKRDTIDLVWFGGSFLLGFLFLYNMSNILGAIPANFLGFILAGAVCALGVLVPGLSPSNLLLVFGLYDPMLKGFKEFNLVGVYLPIVIGAIAIILLFSKFMEYLLKKFHSRVYHFILGIVLASTLLIVLPPVANYTSLRVSTVLLAIALFIVGTLLGRWMSKLEEKYK
jgi:putative membrane protein